MKLLKLEWYKLKSYRTFYVLLGLFTVFFVLINYGMLESQFGVQTSGGGSINVLSNNYSFPEVWANLGYYYGWMMIFVCIAVVISITNEFRYRTHRQNIIDGLSRNDFLHSKVWLVLGLNVVMLLIYLMAGFVFGFAGDNEFTTDGMENVFYAFVMGMNYLGFSAMLAFLLKRSGLAITLLLAFVVFENVIIKLIQKFTELDLSDYFPLECSDSLFEFPLSQTTKMAIAQGGEATPVLTYIVISLVYVALYYGVVRWKLSKADL
ncbi:MAG: ABC transporter permease subunit [Bacteroidia bacterium]|nr:ABC transporter permease subunit [Bacteroidia bacterium]